MQAYRRDRAANHLLRLRYKEWFNAMWQCTHPIAQSVHTGWPVSRGQPTTVGDSTGKNLSKRKNKIKVFVFEKIKFLKIYQLYLTFGQLDA